MPSTIPLNLPISVCLTGCDSMEILNQALNVARNFTPLSQAEVSTLLSKTETAAQNGEFEHYKFATYA